MCTPLITSFPLRALILGCWSSFNADLRVRPKHAIVREDTGCCAFPYLRDWTEANDLVNCVTFLQKEFSRVPPLFASASSSAPTTRPPPVSASSSTSHLTHSTGPPSARLLSATTPPYPSSSTSTSTSSSTGTSTHSSAVYSPSGEVSSQLLQRYLQTAVQQFFRQTASNIDCELSGQRKLTRHRARIHHTVDELRARKVASWGFTPSPPLCSASCFLVFRELTSLFVNSPRVCLYIYICVWMYTCCNLCVSGRVHHGAHCRLSWIEGKQLFRQRCPGYRAPSQTWSENKPAALPQKRLLTHHYSNSRFSRVFLLLLNVVRHSHNYSSLSTPIDWWRLSPRIQLSPMSSINSRRHSSGITFIPPSFSR
jgi:hypothetical protein